jgi:adhesin transport system outer membrane protein
MSIIVAASLFTTLNAASLKETINETLISNNEIISNQLKIKSAQKDIEIEEGRYYPTLDLEAYLEKSQTQNDPDNQSKQDWVEKDGYRATLSASQLLYDGGNTPSRVRAAKHTLNETVNKYTQRNEDIIYEIVEAYTDIIKFNELKQLSNYGDDAHKQALEVAYDKEEISGEALETLRTLSLISTQEDKKFALDSDLARAESKFKNLTLKNEIGTLCRPNYDTSVIPDDLDSIIQMALKQNFRIQEQREIVKAQREIIEQENAKFRPDVRLNLSAALDQDLELVENGEQKELIGQVFMNWNFYNGGVDTKTLDKEKIRLNEEQKNLEKITNDVVESITNEYTIYLQSINRIDNFQKSIDSQKEILDLTKNQLEDGTKTFIDLLQAKNTLVDSQNNKIRQEIQHMNSYHKILAELSMLSQTVINSEDQVCKDTKVNNLINEEVEKEEENLDDLLSIDSDLNNSDAITESPKVDGPTLEEQVEKLLTSNDEVYFDKENFEITIQTTPSSFKKGVLNQNSNFANNLNSFSSSFMQILDKNKEQIKTVYIEGYTSSEYRGVEGLENKFKANLRTASKRANEVRYYFINDANKHGLDTQWVKRIMTDIGKGSVDLITDSNGIEDIEASRRVVVKLIKR